MDTLALPYDYSSTLYKLSVSLSPHLKWNSTVFPESTTQLSTKVTKASSVNAAASSVIFQLCKILGITLNDLFGIKSEPADALSQHEWELIFHYRMISPLSQRIVDRMLVSIFDEEAHEKDQFLIDHTNIIARVPTVAAAGNGFSFSDWPVEDFCFVFKNSRNDRADAIISVKGDSMLPVYKNGDEVYVEKTDRAEIGEDVICVSIEGLHIKRLGNDGPYSLNPDYPFTLTEESDHVEIIGRVLGVSLTHLLIFQTCPRAMH